VPDSQVPVDRFAQANLDLAPFRARQAQQVKEVKQGLISAVCIAVGILLALALVYIAPMFSSAMTSDQYHTLVSVISVAGLISVILGLAAAFRS